MKKKKKKSKQIQHRNSDTDPGRFWSGSHLAWPPAQMVPFHCCLCAQHNPWLQQAQRDYSSPWWLPKTHPLLTICIYLTSSYTLLCFSPLRIWSFLPMKVFLKLSGHLCPCDQLKDTAFQSSHLIPFPSTQSHLFVSSLCSPEVSQMLCREVKTISSTRSTCMPLSHSPELGICRKLFVCFGSFNFPAFLGEM